MTAAMWIPGRFHRPQVRLHLVAGRSDPERKKLWAFIGAGIIGSLAGQHLVLGVGPSKVQLIRLGSGRQAWLRAVQLEALDLLEPRCGPFFA